MKLNRVSLQGFLAHYGREIDGAVAPIEFDFTGWNLWLMHGANGSGKSSVFDAITFALFDRARGGQLGKLVNDRSAAAHVEVELEANGERYLVKRHLKLKKNRESHSSSSAEVWRWDAGENRWIAEAGVGKIRDWSERTLKVSYENFVSSVVLEQGRADRFLRATPRERREQLMKLLDLSVYEKISATANARRNESRGELKNKESQLQSCAPVSPDDVTHAERAATEAQLNFDAANDAWGRAQTARNEARRAADLDAQIAEKIARQNEDADVLADAETIENAARERDELNAILPQLRALKNARAVVENAQSDWESARAQRESAQTKERELAPWLEQRHTELERAERALTGAQARAARAELDGARAQDDADKLDQIEELEAEIIECERALEPHRVWLERAETIEARREQITELNEIARKIEPLQAAAQKLARAQTAQNEARAARQSASEKLRNAERELHAASKQNLGEGDALRQERANLAAKLEVNRETLGERDKVGHADECPTCGSILDGSEARERIEHERAMLAREVANWQTRLSQIEAQLDALESADAERARIEEAARTARDKAGQIAAKTDAQWENARDNAEEKTREWQSARDQAGAWASEDLARVRARLAALEPHDIEADESALQKARAAQLQNEATTRATRAQLARLPAWDAEKRRLIGELQRDLQSVLEQLRAELEAAQTAADDAKTQHENARDALAQARNDAHIARGLDEQKAAALREKRADLDAQLAGVAQFWRAHEAARDDDALDALSARFNDLRALAARAAELNQARQRVRDLESGIKVLRAQIAAIPAEHRIEVEQAERVLSGARAARQNAEESLQSARKRAIQVASARMNLERCERERNAAQLEFGRDADLAEALGSDGLQARIIKQAQENLRGAANDILGRLSKGQWQIDLREAGDDKEKELEIVARDLARGGVERAFDALSGGERFRVAISLAIAIGQMAAGGAPMNTLVIDEGFGALDEENRGLMVDNLRHLSERELKNGRVIVVSHQNDVQDFFGHRYQISRGATGYAQIEMTVG